ncbi:putative multidrug resistance protein MdtD [Streptomyces sp. RB5]|uniref:Putative multidrug resistance protein MdtD n=1 Tax=Streptomyces smaragdinus TaxID=2585196 RepID=A0A7K0CQH1_9ACTN|nr:MFS transporter [Streptomyces smaragdinus]MQY15641.1 putative multidrug resistance protein MdtD [Streptomyces smaragdinus]
MAETTPVLTQAHRTDTTTGPRPGRPRLGWLLAIVLTGQFMALLDVFIVNVAAPTLAADLDASGSGLQMIIAGYTITYAVLLITGARLGGLLGHRRMFLAGLTVFTLASLACGLGQSTGQLIAFRLVQGAGAAVAIPQVLSLIQRNFTGAARVRALGAYSAVLATGAAAGQIAGGLLVSADLFGTGWRPVFLVNVPIGLALLVLGARLLPRDESHAGARAGNVLDRGGLVLLAAAVALVTVPLVLGEELGWPLWGWASLVGGLALAGVFAGYEARLGRRGGAPLFPAHVLASGRMPVALVRTVLSMAVNAGFLFVLTLHLQSDLGYSAQRTGLTFVPTAFAFGVVGLTWQRLPRHWWPRLIPVGFALSAVSFAAVGLALRDGGGTGALFFAGCVGVGAGLGFAFNTNLTLALATVEPADAPHASGLLVTAAQLGLLLGVATVGTLYLHRLDSVASSSAQWASALALAGTAAAGVFAGAARRRG